MSNHHQHVVEWERGLPALEDLTPLTQSLITPELAGAFSIPHKNPTYALQASQATQQQSLFSDEAAAGGAGYGFAAEGGIQHALEAMRGQEAAMGLGVCDSSNDGSTRKPKQGDAESEETDSGNSGDDPSARTLKRPRLVWTPQLHKRFVDAVAQLGIKSAVPKTIMQLMNVEGLTRENVASHLQKYRLYLKRMQEGPSSASSDALFASTPVPPALAAQAHFLHQGGHDLGFSMNAAMPVAGLCPPQMAMYPGFDHHAFATIARGVQQQRMPSGDYREMLNMENHSQMSQPGSPPRRVLTLFPNNRT